MTDPHKYSNPWQLTPREEEALSLMGVPTRVPAVAEQMGVTVATVRASLDRASKKMDTHSSLEAVLKYERWAARRRPLPLAVVQALAAEAGCGAGDLPWAVALVRRVERAHDITDRTEADQG